MKHGCDHSVRVTLTVAGPAAIVGSGRQPRTGLRNFIVEFDANSEVLRIKEIMPLKAPQSGIYHHPYWRAGIHPLGIGDTLPKRIIAAARAKMAAENRNINATP